MYPPPLLPVSFGRAPRVMTVPFALGLVAEIAHQAGVATVLWAARQPACPPCFGCPACPPCPGAPNPATDWRVG
eukprot:7832603-Pyramimonas_sp.AAC.1